MNNYADDLISSVVAKNPGEPEFHQAVTEVVRSLAPVMEKSPQYRKAKILERMVVPERTIMFRVPMGKGANIAGFLKVADSMTDQGVI
jgi:glutamate dehydrogenase (NADP+)